MNVDLNFNYGSIFLKLHLEEETNQELNKKDKENRPIILIEGKAFHVTIIDCSSEITKDIQQKLADWKIEDNLNLKQFCSRILNINPESFNLDEKYATLSSIQQLAQQTIPSIPLKKKQEENIQHSKLNELIIVHDKILKELNEATSSLNNFYSLQELEKIHYKALSSLKEMMVNIKIANLEKQLKEHKLEILHIYYMLHQQIVVKDTDLDAEKQRAMDRLNHLLDQAIIVDHIAYVNRLIKAGAKIEDYHLFYAIVTNASEVMDKLIEAGGNPNAITQDGKWSLLQMACFRGSKSEQAACALVRNGADLKKQDGNKNTPIHAAIESNLSNETIEDFLRLIQDPNFTNQQGETLLHTAVNRFFMYGDPKILEVLLSLKVDLNKQDERGCTPLHLTIQPYKSGVLEIAKVLIKAGADVKIADKKGRTALHYAAERSIINADRGKKDGGKLTHALIVQGAQVNAQDNRGQTPLHKAVGQGVKGANQKTVLELINNGANLDIQDKEGNTPLHLAVWMEHIDHVRTLLERGANRDIRNNEGKLPGAMGVLGKGLSQKNMETILTLLAKT